VSAGLDYDALARSFLEAQLAGDRRAALRVVIEEGLGRGARLVDVQARVIGAAQQEIGRLWQANRVSIAQEHLATGISQLVLAHLYDHAQATPRNGRVVAVACVEGELHDLPARLVADYLDQAGFTVRYYGANVPTDDLVPMLARDRPALLGLSATMSFHLAALRSAVARVREAFGDALPILVGGHAIDWSAELAASLPIGTAPSTPEELVAAVRRLTGVS
jgi:MerR family transcriptional regulator, light-induced transcriptional regulator